MEFLWLLAALIFAHLLCDYPLQGDFLAKAKNRMAPIPGIPWRQALSAHAGIHGLAVAFLCGSLILRLAEFLCHWLIDDMKCRDQISFNQDQAWHLACKAVWALAAVVIF